MQSTGTKNNLIGRSMFRCEVKSFKDPPDMDVRRYVNGVVVGKFNLETSREIVCG
jgi:hypothetical protein